jgi:uncharacterized membrane protein (DUF485 family)
VNAGELLNDPGFRRLMQRRSRLRWGLTTMLTAAYIGYGMLGLYAAPLLAAPFFSSTVSWGIVAGYGIIVLGIASSIFYVWQVNRIIAPLQARLAGEYS